MAKETPIWDENNTLVDNELDQHFREQSDIVLGKGQTEPETVAINLNQPAISQRLPSQTRDVMTSPEPSADPNSRPSELTPMPDNVAALDRQIADAAKPPPPPPVNGDSGKSAASDVPDQTGAGDAPSKPGTTP